MVFKRKGETYLCEQVTDSACARGLNILVKASSSFSVSLHFLAAGDA